MTARAMMRIAGVGTLLLVCSVAGAAIQTPALTITAQNDLGTVSETIPLSSFAGPNVAGIYSYSLPATTFENQTTFENIFTLTSLNLFMVDTPQNSTRIVMNYGVVAGAGSLPTTFTITPGLMSFWQMPSDQTRAKMSWTLSLGEQSGDGYAQLRGLSGGAIDIYRAFYNNGVGFGACVTNLEASGIGATNGANEPGTFVDLNVPVDKMNVTTGFTLTPGDSMQLQSTFVILPEPTAILLLGVAGLMLARRR